MSESLSTDQIEREIEAERVALTRALNELQREISPEAIVERVSGFVRGNGGEIAETALRQIRANPLALAITGAGLAWLIAGPAKHTAQPLLPKPDPDAHQVDYDHRSYETTPGFRHESRDEQDSFEARLARAEGDLYDPSIRPEGRWTRKEENMTDEDIRTTQRKQSLMERLTEGTESMTETARERVMAAREAAILAEQRLEARARDYGNAGKEAFNSQPLMGALVAFGVGALAGALLPRTRVEDRHLGAARDRAMLEAERVYRVEMARLRGQAEAVAEETVAAASDALRSAAQPKTGGAKTSDDRDHSVN